MRNTINQIKKDTYQIFDRHGVTRAGVFGSFSQKKEKKNSDVDFLIEIKKEISLLEFIALKMDLEKALKRKVDLVEYETIKPTIKDSVLKDEIPIYERR